MVYKEIKGDLFTVPNNFYLAHCISSDYALGAGIAVAFQKKFHLRGKLQQADPTPKFPQVLLIDRVFNLITKDKCYHKPTLESLKETLRQMKEIIVEKKIEHLAMPKIGCGLDRLQWGEVSKAIQETFEDVKWLEIRVYYI